ncbi:uncharacterized protein LOC144561645 isoform X2 [Carex rostrata]
MASNRTTLNSLEAAVDELKAQVAQMQVDASLRIREEAERNIRRDTTMQEWFLKAMNDQFATLKNQLDNPVSKETEGSGNNHFRENGQFDRGRRDMRIQAPRQDFPSFEGDNPAEWVSKCHYYFELYQIPEDHKTVQAVLNFKGVASEWYRGYNVTHDHPTWPELVNLVKRRFSDTENMSAFEELKRLYQTHTVKEYMERFEKVKTRSQIEAPYLPEDHFTNAFISGLNEDIKHLVLAMKPINLLDAFEQARHMEIALNYQAKKNKAGFKVNQSVPQNQMKLVTDKPRVFDDKPVNAVPTQKNALIEQRRALGLCFKCGDKYYPGHQCKIKVHMLVSQDEEGEIEDDTLPEMAYIQQLETSSMKLAQLEQELDRTRNQGGYISGHLGESNVGLNGAVNSGIAAFEIEYANWVEEQTRLTCELRSAIQAQLSDIELHMLVDSGMSHYENLYRIKAIAARSDVFYIMSGMWRTSAERFFLWMGGFRPSELLKILVPQLEPLAESQTAAVNGLRKSSQQAEDALSLGMEKLQQTLSETLTLTMGPLGGPDAIVNNYMCQMTNALGKLEALVNFVNQGDHLRQEALQQMYKILTIRQAARGLLVLGDYFQRLRALSSLWAARPREPS